MRDDRALAPSWIPQPMAAAPRDRRVLLVDRHANFSVASWRAVGGDQRPGWVVSRAPGAVIVFESPVAWFELPDFVLPEDRP